MRKLTAFALILCMMANYVVTEEAVNELRVIFSPGVGGEYWYYLKDANGKPIKENGEYVLDKKYTSNSGMEDQVEDAYNAFRTVKNYTKQVMIGHSQGGYRALGYANLLKEKGEGDMLEAIICITPPARGFTPLIQGIDATTKRIAYVVDTIGIGVGLTVFPHPLTVPVVKGWLWTILGGDTKSFLSNMLGENLCGQLVTDFTPGSSYIANRINPNYSAIQGHWEQRIVGYRNPPRPRPRGDEWDPEIEYQPIPIYQSVWVIDKPAQITQTKMPPNMKLGFITANDKNFFGFSESSGLAYKVVSALKADPNLAWLVNNNFSDSENIRNYFSILSVAFEAGIVTNAALAIYCASAAIPLYASIVGIPAALVLTAAAALYTYNTGCITAALCITADFSTYYNKNLLLTDQSDGFIPTAAESRAIEEMGCQKIDGPRPYVVNFFDNHNSVCYDPLIWGEGGNMCQPSNDQNALLMRWMLANGYSGWEQNYVNWMSDTNVTYKP